VHAIVDVEEEEIYRQAEIQARSMPLSVVRLSFRAYLLDGSGMCIRVLPAIISNPIFDSSTWIAYLFYYLYTYFVASNFNNYSIQ